MKSAERLLVILNEDPPGAHGDVHSALRRLRADESVQGFQVYPYKARLTAASSPDVICAEIVELASAFQPSQVLWCHTGELAIPRSVFGAMAGSAHAPAHGYWEGDWYHPRTKPFASQAVAVATQCDIAFLCGRGYLTNLLLAHGCPRVDYVPSVADERFAEFDGVPREPRYDLVLVANNNGRRNPMRRMEGVAERKRLIRLFERRLGRRFAVFGHGWSGPSARGVVGFEEQVDAYRQAHVVLGNNDLHAGLYFSNRLPIAMMAGRHVVHRREPGLELLFEGLPSIRWFSSMTEAWSQFEAALDAAKQSSSDTARARNYAINRLSTRAAFAYMSKALAAIRVEPKSASDSPVRSNPWVGMHGLRTAPK